MKLNYVKKIAMLFVLLSLPLLVGAAPTLIPIGGFVESTSFAGFGNNDSSSVPLNGEFGTFEALSSISASTIDPNSVPISGRIRTAESRAFATINSTNLSVSGKVDGFRDFLFPSFKEGIFGGTATAKITFALTEPTSVRFQWVGDSFGVDPIASVLLKNDAGDVFLSCLGASNCFDRDPFSEIIGLTEGLGGIGRINLDIGKYEVLLNASDSIQVGNSGGGAGSLSLQVVPVPAAVWLFGSGLIGLLGVRRSRVKLSDEA